MARKARIDSGVVAEILDSGEAQFPPFHPDLLWVDCSIEVKEQYTYSNGIFLPPIIIKEPQQIISQKSAIEKLQDFLNNNPDVHDLLGTK